MPRHKSVPRVRATPRQIRDIKPKRQLPRTQTSEQSDEWWQEADETLDASNNISPGGDNRTNTVASGGSQEAESAETHNILKRCQHYCWGWYKRTPRIKKMKQIFWLFILYRTLKLIYVLDLDNLNSFSKWDSSTLTSYDSLATTNSRPLGKSFFSDEDLAEAARYSSKTSSFGGSSLDASSFLSKNSLSNDRLGQYSSGLNSMSKSMNVGGGVTGSYIKNGAIGGGATKDMESTLFAPPAGNSLNTKLSNSQLDLNSKSSTRRSFGFFK